MQNLGSGKISWEIYLPIFLMNYIYIYIYMSLSMHSLGQFSNHSKCMCIIHWNLKFYVAIIKDCAFVVEIHAKIYGGLCPFYVLGVGYTNFMNLFVSPLYFWLTFLLHWNLHVLPHNILFFTHVGFLVFLNVIIYFYFQIQVEKH